jgi:hypothetical protein
MASVLKWPYARTVIPRLCVIAFSYSQTFLINASITYLDTPTASRDKNHAYGLIGAAIFIYGGLAVCCTINFPKKIADLEGLKRKI